jgi:hypothetical protein
MIDDLRLMIDVEAFGRDLLSACIGGSISSVPLCALCGETSFSHGSCGSGRLRLPLPLGSGAGFALLLAMTFGRRLILRVLRASVVLKS